MLKRIPNRSDCSFTTCAVQKGDNAVDTVLSDTHGTKSMLDNNQNYGSIENQRNR